MNYYTVQVIRTEVDVTAEGSLETIKVWRDVQTSDGRVYTFTTKGHASDFIRKWYEPAALAKGDVRIKRHGPDHGIGEA